MSKPDTGKKLAERWLWKYANGDVGYVFYSSAEAARRYMGPDPGRPIRVAIVQIYEGKPTAESRRWRCHSNCQPDQFASEFKPV